MEADRHVLPAEVVVRVRRRGARGAVRLALEQVLRVRVERQLHRRRVCARRVRVSGTQKTEKMQRAMCTQCTWSSVEASSASGSCARSCASTESASMRHEQRCGASPLCRVRLPRATDRTTADLLGDKCGAVQYKRESRTLGRAGAHASGGELVSTANCVHAPPQMTRTPPGKTSALVWHSSAASTPSVTFTCEPFAISSAAGATASQCNG